MRQKLLALFLALFLLLAGCKQQMQIPQSAEELRGMWVATTLNLDFPSKPGLSAEELRAETDALLDEAEQMGINAIFFQVRPCGDALYPSKLYPWSASLSGTQGVSPDKEFDALAYWIEACHARGMQLHAWINPFRVTQSAEDVISEMNPAKLHPEWTVAHSDGKCYLNPGIPEVRQYILDGVLEIVDRYQVDGIHFDDYFYPDESFPDEETFAASGADDLLDWRRENINKLISETQAAIDRIDKGISFGVSPFGIWQNLSSSALGSNTRGLESYSAHAVDSRRWVKEGWVDYIAPQIYWHIGHELADYQTLVDWWSDVVDGTNAKLYIGHAGYRSLAAEPGTVWYGGEELERQLEMNKANSAVSGSIHFRIGCYLQTPELVSVLKEQYIEQE